MAVKIDFVNLFASALASLSGANQKLALAAIAALPAIWGEPHQHSGLSIRRLRPGVYECRASQSVRLLFTRHGDTLLLRTVGNHDDIRAWLKNNR